VLCAILLHCCYWPSVELLSLSRLKIWVAVVGAVVCEIVGFFLIIELLMCRFMLYL
jgi:hypothetical protein